MDLKTPSSKALNLYTCGPTVYNFAHIGNLRSYIFADLVYRSKSVNWQTPKQNVKWVMNITDIDDKTIRNTIEKFGAKAEVKDLKKYTEQYTKLFLQDLNKLNVSVSGIKFIKVSEVIPQIQDFIIKLIDKGYAYKAEDGSTYFNIEKYQQDFGHYGDLVGKKFLAGKKIGARVKVDEYDKDDLSDFALWKAREKNDANIFWSHPILGEGRPGWHIECSVINQVAFNGETTDIHTGGVDLTFPHHTNEIAQSEALTGQTFVHEWLHSEHLLVDNKKMSKSLGNIFTLEDLEKKGFNPLAYRYLLLQTSYKQKVNFTWESLEAAQKGYDNLKRKIKALKKQLSWWQRLFVGTITRRLPSGLPEGSLRADYLSEFSSKISTFNTASALASLQLVISTKDLTTSQKLKLIAKFDEVLGLKLI